MRLFYWRKIIFIKVLVPTLSKFFKYFGPWDLGNYKRFSEVGLDHEIRKMNFSQEMDEKGEKRDSLPFGFLGVTEKLLI